MIIGESGILELDSDIQINSISVLDNYQTFMNDGYSKSVFTSMQESLCDLMSTVLETYSDIV
jgi:hypothetical protein